MARTQSNLASQLADIQGSLEIGPDESQPHAAPLRSQPSAMPGQNKPAAKLSKRASMPSDLLHHMASEAETLTHASTLARQPTLSETLLFPLVLLMLPANVHVLLLTWLHIVGLPWVFEL